MNNTYLNKLEFYKIKETLSKKCSTLIAKKIIEELQPSNNPETVKTEISETSEGVNLIIKNGNFSISNFEDTNEMSSSHKSILEIYIKNIESKGTLSKKALLTIANVLKNANELKNYFNQEHINKNDFPHLEHYFSILYSNQNITNKIFNSIIDENTIADNASSTLNNIRNKKIKLEQNIKNKLNSFIHSNKYSKYIQESVITIRNDRFVIPVKEEYRSQINGFIHDTSSSGSTVFIEPISIFEMNNEITNLKLEERIEIEKILQQLSSLLYPYVEEIKTNIKTIGKIDFILAKANYSLDLKATRPIITEKKSIHLINAKHPLIDQAIAVPINVELGNSYQALVITGPNTGGKTVTLKTVGLLCAMALSGLHIPAQENSSIYVFDQIFADIGDNQSISESLSTFSSHMANIIHILNESTDKSLILLDELGSGTDPLEGSHLAISILEEFQKINALTISTTHYQELKKYALTNKNFMNASVEFDIENLKPTYKLLIGIPGKSNAFEISKKLGLKKSIIKRAQLLINSEELNIEDLLKEIYDNKSKIEKEKEEISKKLKDIENLKNSLECDNTNLKQQEEQILLTAKTQARQILLDAKDEVNYIINKLSSSTNQEANLLRNNLNNSIKNLTITNSTKIINNDKLDRKDIKPNLNVFILSLNQEGTIISNINKNDEVRVQIGNMKINVKLDDLQKSKSASKQKTTISSTIPSKSKSISSEINVIGLTVDEALFVIDKYLDDCIIAKLQSARIIHGKGTGALRNGIWKYLKNKNTVKSYRMGTFGEGEMGATIVLFK